MLLTAHSRTKYARLGVPAAVIGVVASTLAAAPAQASDAALRETSTRETPTIGSPTAPVAHAAPATSPAPTAYTVRSGDTVYAVAQRFGLTVADVLSWNGLDGSSVIHPGQTLVLTAPTTPAVADPPAPATHTVVAGDTIFGLAQQYGTTVDAILAANGLDGASIIYPGQTISIPAAETATGTTVSSPLNEFQAENATMIVRIGRELGVSDRGIAIALGTSMVESWLRNLQWGDRDSMGLFQQRPSTGWGTPDQIMDRDYSIRAFFLGTTNADGTTTRGLLDVPGWEGMAFADAAQAVQVSAYPSRYADWESAAYEWLAVYG